MIFALFLLTVTSPLFLTQASLQTADPKPKLSYSWQDTTFSFSQELDWENETISLADSGNYSETYSTIFYEYRPHFNEYIKENRTITHSANYSSVVERVTSGNATINTNLDAYRVNIDYGLGVKLLWFAMKGGTFEYEYYLKKDLKNYHYYEENHRHIVSHFEERDMDTHALIHEWTIIQDVPGEVNTTVSKGKEWYPFFEHTYWYAEIIKPMILSVQLFNTEKNDKIAWAHLFHEFYIYKDTNLDSILTIHDNPEDNDLPSLYSSTELIGLVNPMAISQYSERENNESLHTKSWSSYPSDKSLEEISSAIEFTPPTETSNANVSWGIKYPDFPLYMDVHDFDRPMEEWYHMPYNATFNEMCPTNLTYGFDFSISEVDANLDITWGIGKLTNATAFDAVQGYGLLIPQYNFFLSNFEIEEEDAPFLSVPRDTFTFTSNDSVVAEINMGSTKKNYTLYNSTAGEEFIYPSSGGSIHKHAIQFADENSFYDNPLINCLFSLRDAVAADTSFIVQDDLFSMETQNYPVWSGEQLVHDPSLIIYHGEPPGQTSGGDAIPSYNLPLLLGIAGIMMTLILVKYRNKHQI